VPTRSVLAPNTHPDRPMRLVVPIARAVKHSSVLPVIPTLLPHGRCQSIRYPLRAPCWHSVWVPRASVPTGRYGRK